MAIVCACVWCERVNLLFAMSAEMAASSYVILYDRTITGNKVSRTSSAGTEKEKIQERSRETNTHNYAYIYSSIDIHINTEELHLVIVYASQLPVSFQSHGTFS